MYFLGRQNVFRPGFPPTPLHELATIRYVEHEKLAQKAQLLPQYLIQGPAALNYYRTSLENDENLQ